tara:strand:+ start:543 stop:773 length:231 start_codon:yes stop_codon:yes gene_type:complete
MNHKVDKIIEYFRNLREDAPTMNTGTPNGSAGFSASADSSGPVAGNTYPLSDGRKKMMRRLSPFYRKLFNKTQKKK